MSARTRRSLTLLWAALFLCSLLMQYGSFAAPASVLGAHDEGIFELDGNADDQAAPGDDWENGTPGAIPGGSVFIAGTAEADGVDTTYFKEGGSKDHRDLSAWEHSSTDVAPDKDEILDAFAAAFVDGAGDTWAYFGADKFDDSGDAQIGFWFFQDDVSLGANGAFNGLHVVGDVLILSDFTNGGAISQICVYEWNPPGSDGLTGTDCDKGDNVTLVAAGVDCDVADSTFQACARVNEAVVNAPWAFVNKDGETDFGIGQFYEGGINLSDVFGGSPPCFSSFLAETRSSQEVEAQLKDFALGSFDTCVPPTIATQVKQGTTNVNLIQFGESVTDTATLSGTHGNASGTVEFFVCYNATELPDCATGGTSVSTETVDTSGNPDTATSDPYQANAVGYYCFRAEYTPDADSEYLEGSHTNRSLTIPGNECFRVEPADVRITKTPNSETKNAGESISFTISWGNAGTGLATGVVVTDDLPDPAGVEWSISAFTGSGSTCSLGGTPADQTLTCNVGSIPGSTAVHGTVTLTSATTAASCGVIDNTGSISSTNDGSASDPGQITVQCPDVRVTKEPDEGDGNDVNAGETATFSITVENLGPGTATNVSLSDNLPSGLDWTLGTVSGDTTGVVCGISGPVGTEVLTCTDSSMASGDSFTVQVSAPTDAGDCPSIANTATVSAGNEPAGNTGNNSDAGEIDVLCASIGITKTANPPGPVNAGDQIGFDITVTNSGGGTAFNVDVDDALPTNAGLDWSIAPGYPTGDTTGLTCSISGSIGAETLDCTDPSMATGDSFTVRVVSGTTAASCATIENRASVGTSNDGSANATASVTVECPDVHVTKTAGDDTISAGELASFTITISNAGPGDAYNATISDTLPAGVTWAEDPENGNCSITGNVLSCTYAILAAGEDDSVTVTGLTDAADCAGLNNLATVDAANEANSGHPPTDNTASATITVQCPDLDIDKEPDSGDAGSVINAGDTASFTITVTNHGPGTAFGVVLDDTLPAGLIWSETPDKAECAISGGNVLHCDIGTLGDDASFSVTVSAVTTADDCGTLPNTAFADASNDDQVSDPGQLTVNCPDLDVEKTADSSPISAGEVASFTITVTNLGDGTAYDATLSDTLPAGVPWVVDGIQPVGAATCDPIVGGVLTCDFGDVLPDEVITIYISGETVAANCGTLHNEVDVEATNEPSNVLENNHDEADVLVNCPDIVLTKTADDDSVSAGQDIGFEIEVTNTAASGSAFGVHVVDDLPGDAGTSWTIESTSGDTTGLVCAIDTPNGTLICDKPTLAAGGSFIVHIVSPTTAATCPLVDNTAVVTTSNDGGDDDSAAVTVNCPNISITKEPDAGDGGSVILPGGTAVFTITVSNAGPGVADDVVLDDTLPAGLTWTENPDRAQCTIGGGNSLHCAIGDLAAGGSFSVTVQAVTPAAQCADLPNLATADATNDDAVSDTGLIECARIDVVKTAGASTSSQAADGSVYVTRTDTASGSTATVVFKYHVTNTGSATLNGVTVTDDNATASASDDLTISCPKSTLAPGESMDCFATLAVGLGTRTNVATVTGTTPPPATSVSDTDDAVVRVPDLDIEKAVAGNSAGSIGGTPQAKEGDTLTFTLTYDLTAGPVSGGVITDVLPVGYSYVAGSATASSPGGEFTFTSFTAGTRTLRWDAANVTQDGSVSYQVVVVAGAAELAQPLLNVATITSAQTWPDSDDQPVLVQVPPLAATATPRITPPPTDLDEQAPSNPGFTLMLVLLGLAGFVLTVGYLTPVPERARRRDRR